MLKKIYPSNRLRIGEKANFALFITFKKSNRHAKTTSSCNARTHRLARRRPFRRDVHRGMQPQCRPVQFLFRRATGQSRRHQVLGLHLRRSRPPVRPALCDDNRDIAPARAGRYRPVLQEAHLARAVAFLDLVCILLRLPLADEVDRLRARRRLGILPLLWRNCREASVYRYPELYRHDTVVLRSV